MLIKVIFRYYYLRVRKGGVMRYLFLLFFPLFLYANSFSYKLSYFQETKPLELREVKKEKFKAIKNNYINRGFNFNTFWIKLEVQNNSNERVKKIFSLDNPTVDFLSFYEDEKLKTSTGDHAKNISREIQDIYFAFNIELEPKERKTYYLKVRTDNAFVIKFFVEDKKLYTKNSNLKKMFLFFFFGFLSSIIIYNAFLFFILKEKSYLIYVLFESATLGLLLASSGLGSFMLWQDSPLFNEFVLKTLDDLAILLGLIFTQSFLNIRWHFPNLNKFINIVLMILLYVMITPWEWHYMIVKPVMIGSITLILFVAIYGVYKKIPSSKMFLLAWMLLMIGAIITLLKNFGTIDIHYMSKWAIYIGAMLEAIVFSIALAKKIEALKIAKQKALSISKDYLNAEVLKKTHYLDEALKQKEILLREIHHRVKNNLQIISSFVAISSLKEKNEESKDRYEALNQRIQAISMLHDFFYKQENIDKIDTKKYITNIVNNLNIAYNYKNKNIEFKYNIIPCDIEFEKLVLVALIINELVTNSFKYAFKDAEDAKIRISFFRRNSCYYLAIRDNGMGFDFDLNNLDSIGLKIVHRLAQKQLGAKVNFKSSDKKTAFTFVFE